VSDVYPQSATSQAVNNGQANAVYQNNQFMQQQGQSQPQYYNNNSNIVMGSATPDPTQMMGQMQGLTQMGSQMQMMQNNMQMQNSFNSNNQQPQFTSFGNAAAHPSSM
jgi:hypothetical protein